MTPKLGKRKRNPQIASVDTAGDDDEDELSPNRDPENAPSIEKSRKAPPPVSPIREEEDDLVDELSLVGDVAGSTRKHRGALASARKTPTPTVASAAASGIRRREKSTSTGPVTPATLADIQKRPTPKTPHVEEDADESPDELTPDPTDAPTVRPKTKSPSILADLQDVDELSPEQIKDTQPLTASLVVGRSKRQQAALAHTSTPDMPRRRGRPRKIVAEEEEEDIIQTTPAQSKPRRISNSIADADEAADTSNPNIRRQSGMDGKNVAEGNNTPATIATGTSTPAKVHEPGKSRKRGRPRRVVAEEEEDTESVPTASKARRITNKTPEMDPSQSAPGEEEDGGGADELSPDIVRSKPKSRTARKKTQDMPVGSEAREAEDGSTQHTGEAPTTSTHRASSMHQQTPTIEPSIDKPRKKRQKRGPTQAIQVMRLEGSGTRELTVVDTTRHVLEQWTAHKIEKMTNKLGRLTSTDAAQARKLRQHRNVVLVYKDEIDDVLLGLQDANDTGNHRATQYKRAYRENKQLRDQVHELERERQKVALDNDEATAEFLHEKEELVTRDKLSTSLYDIQSAIRSGKDKAQKEGRENEGPELSLKMVLDDVASSFGSRGLLARVKNFNGFLGKAAGIFEGKA